jgi:lysophospholipase L1-like esterase
MVEYMDDSTIGLRSALDGIRNPSLSLVIILAGTNDIGSITSSMSGNKHISDEDGEINKEYYVSMVVDLIVRLHQSCLDCVSDSGKKDMRTLAIGIPGSAWQEINSKAARLCSDVNEALKQYASNSEGRVTYMDFPFHYRRGDNKWCGDGLHLSPEGYETLGISVAPCVKELLLL